MRLGSIGKLRHLRRLECHGIEVADLDECGLAPKLRTLVYQGNMQNPARVETVQNLRLSRALANVQLALRSDDIDVLAPLAEIPTLRYLDLRGTSGALVAHFAARSDQAIIV
jgi:hypothetical protein